MAPPSWDEHILFLFGASLGGSPRGRLSLLADDLFRLLVSSQSLKRRMADLSVARPLGEDDFADQIRPDPVRVAPQRSCRRRRERGRLDLDAIELRAQVERHLVREAGAD